MISIYSWSVLFHFLIVGSFSRCSFQLNQNAEAFFLCSTFQQLYTPWLLYFFPFVSMFFFIAFNHYENNWITTFYTIFLCGRFLLFLAWVRCLINVFLYHFFFLLKNQVYNAHKFVKMFLFFASCSWFLPVDWMERRSKATEMKLWTIKNLFHFNSTLIQFDFNKKKLQS